MAATGHSACHLIDHLMNLNGASCPRMPKIDDFAVLGPMGVASSRCTIPNVHTRALTAVRPIRLTSQRCRSARQHNNGRRSTYRRGFFVQKNRAGAIRIGVIGRHPLRHPLMTELMDRVEYYL